MRWKFFGVDSVGGARNAVLRPRSRCIGVWLIGGTIGCRVIRRSCLFGRYDRAVIKCSRLRSGSDRGLALIRGSPQLRVSAGSLHMLSLNRHRRDMSLTCCHLVFRPWLRVYPPLPPL
jgi:hypothetical protein